MINDKSQGSVAPQGVVGLLTTLLHISCSVCLGHSLANWDSCPTPAKSEAIEYLQVGPTEIRYSIAWTIFVYL